MALRQTPHHSPVNSISFAPESPSAISDAKHRAQLASYKRDPTKSAAAARLATLQSAPSRRRSLFVEDGIDHDEKKYKRRSALLSPFKQVSSRNKRISVYILLALTGYLFLVRPILRPHTTAEAGAASATPHTPITSRHFVAPLHQRQSKSSDASSAVYVSLPPAVQYRSAIDHPVKNGLLQVNPESKFHPIYQLIRDGRAAWEAKNKKQSRTLLEATKEYRRRYGRQPPKGFDLWWNYVVENNVILPDEYDQIHRDLLPFRALSPKTLNERIASTATIADVYTLRIKHGSLRTSVTYKAEEIEGADDRLNGQAELLRPIARWLPDMTMVFSVHDTAKYLLGWDHRQELEERVEEGEYLDAHEEIDTTLRGFAAACSRNAPIRNANRFAPLTHIVPETSISSKSFIASHSAMFDLCNHPELVPLHGALSGRDPHVDQLIPLFSLSKTILHADILGVPTEQWTEDFPVIDWKERTDERLLWRGSNTGAYFSQDTMWRSSHRARLVRMANYQAEQEEEKLTVLPAPREKGTLRDKIKEVSWEEANVKWMDIAFTGEPIQCNEEDGSCADLQAEFPFVERMTHDGALNSKYIVDIDGNAWSARFKRLLTSGSLIFKSTIMPEWWTDRIQPWVHYIPVKLDYSDLYDAVSFFKGDLNEKNGEPNLAEEIAKAGREWSLNNWRKEDMRAYVFRLYLEWGRLTADRRGDMDFVYDESMERARN